MRYLTREASSLFLKTSKLALIAGGIGWTHFHERLAALRSMCRPHDPSYLIATRILALEEWDLESNWELGEESRVPSDERKNQVTSNSSRIAPSADGDDYSYFCTTSIPGLTAWQFNKHDDDFFPSVPHGHWLGQKHPKLDAYLGWTYRGSTQIGREPRRKIISLWNDKKFREFAAGAIDYFISHNILHNGWRVAQPRRLPRRRK